MLKWRIVFCTEPARISLSLPTLLRRYLRCMPEWFLFQNWVLELTQRCQYCVICQKLAQHTTKLDSRPWMPRPFGDCFSILAVLEHASVRFNASLIVQCRRTLLLAMHKECRSDFPSITDSIKITHHSDGYNQQLRRSVKLGSQRNTNSCHFSSPTLLQNRLDITHVSKI